MHLGLRAFAELLKKFPDASITLVGQGPDMARWQRLARDLDIDNKIDWHPWMPQSELTRLYRDHDVFLFPSLHDSGGMVVLEAMAQGLPVVCLKLGGPGVMVDQTCGRAVEVTGTCGKDVVQRLADALVEMAGHPKLMRQLENGAMTQASAYSWDEMAERIYDAVEKDHLILAKNGDDCVCSNEASN